MRASFQALAGILTGIGDFTIVFLIAVVPTVAIFVLAVWIAIKTWRLLRARQVRPS